MIANRLVLSFSDVRDRLCSVWIKAMDANGIHYSHDNMPVMIEFREGMTGAIKVSTLIRLYEAMEACYQSTGAEEQYVDRWIWGDATMFDCNPAEVDWPRPDQPR